MFYVILYMMFRNILKGQMNSPPRPKKKSDGSPFYAPDGLCSGVRLEYRKTPQ